MKLTNGEVFGAREPLQKLVQLPFPVKTSYQLAKLAKVLSGQLQIIDEVRNNLIRKYGKEEGKQVTVDPLDTEKFNGFAKEWIELLVQEVELDITPVKFSEKIASTCDKCHHNMDKTFEIEPATLIALDKFLDVSGLG